MGNDRLKKLKERQAQIEAQIQLNEAREKLKKRKADTRRKIIAGALALEHAAIDNEFGKKLFELLDRYVNRAQERALFGLPPKETGQDNLKETFQKKQRGP